MIPVITDDMVRYVCALSGLELSEEERRTAGQDMTEMLEYMDKLKEADVSGAEPMAHVLPLQNVLREDVVTNGDGSRETLQNAPLRKGDLFVVPKTFGE